MTTNNSGKLNMGGVSAIKDITRLSPSERTPQQSAYLAACLTALAHQPKRWYSYQDWGPGGPVEFLAQRSIEFTPVPWRGLTMTDARATKHTGMRRNHPTQKQRNTAIELNGAYPTIKRSRSGRLRTNCRQKGYFRMRSAIFKYVL